MIKHEAICDKCGKIEQLKYNIEVNRCVDLPEKWEEIGVCPKYQLCAECAFELNRMKREAEHNFIKGDNKQ